MEIGPYRAAAPLPAYRGDYPVPPRVRQGRHLVRLPGGDDAEQQVAQVVLPEVEEGKVAEQALRCRSAPAVPAGGDLHRIPAHDRGEDRPEKRILDLQPQLARFAVKDCRGCPAAHLGAAKPDRRLRGKAFELLEAPLRQRQQFAQVRARLPALAGRARGACQQPGGAEEKEESSCCRQGDRHQVREGEKPVGGLQGTSAPSLRRRSSSSGVSSRARRQWEAASSCFPSALAMSPA